MFARALLSLAFLMPSGIALAQVGDSCKQIVLPSTAQLRGAAPSIGLWVYAMLGDGKIDLGFGGPEPDEFQIEFYSDQIGTFALGTSPDNNFATCNRCVLLSEDLDGISGRKSYFPSEGVLSIGTPPGANELAISITGLRLIEVSINPATSVSTPVPDGGCVVQVSDSIFKHGFEGT